MSSRNSDPPGEDRSARWKGVFGSMFSSLCQLWEGSAPLQKYTLTLFLNFAHHGVLRICGPADLRSCGPELLRKFSELFVKVQIYLLECKIPRLPKLVGFQNVSSLCFFFYWVGPPSSATSVGGSSDTRPTAGIRCVIPLLKSESFKDPLQGSVFVLRRAEIRSAEDKCECSQGGLCWYYELFHSLGIKNQSDLYLKISHQNNNIFVFSVFSMNSSLTMQL